MKDITPIMQALGLLDSEIKTYLVALGLGPSPAADLAVESGLSRQAVYTAIESLNKRGLMTDFLRGKKRFYAAEPPVKLLAYARRKDDEVHAKVKELEEAIPELELQQGGERPIVRIFEGKEGLKGIIEDMKDTQFKNNVEIADLEALYSVLTPEDLLPMRNILKKKGIKVRGLYAGQPGPKILEGDRISLPKEMSGFKADIGVYGDKIEMITFAGKMHSIIIESEPLAQTMNHLFELAFRGAKK